ncbi:MAG: hypothetical protein H0V76_07090 [Blastocatellia bacterium]|nr:hypothetical protein [Blastocatellia bacterium]
MQDVNQMPMPDVDQPDPNIDPGNRRNNDIEQISDEESIPLPPDQQPPSPIEDPPDTVSRPPIEEEDQRPSQIVG